MNSVTVNAVELFNACKTAAKAVNKRQNLAVLTHLLIVEKAGILKVSGFDLDLGITVSVPKIIDSKSFMGSWQCALALAYEAREIERPSLYIGHEGFFSACIPCEALLGALKGAKGEASFSSSSDYEVNLKVSGSEYTLQALPAGDFPSLPRVPQNHELCASELMVCYKENELKSALSAVVTSCASAKETRTCMTGVLFHVSPNSSTFVATDGRRLTERRVLQTSGYIPEGEKKRTVPGPFAQELAKLCASKDTGDRVHISFNENLVYARIGNAELSARVMEENFPDYKRVIPSDDKFRFCFGNDDKKSLCKTLARMIKLPQNKACPHLLKFELSSYQPCFVELESEVGKVREKIEGGFGPRNGRKKLRLTNSGDLAEYQETAASLEIGINGKFLLEALNSLDSDSFSIDFQGDDLSMVIRSNGTHGSIVLMPIKLRKTEEGKAA